MARRLEQLDWETSSVKKVAKITLSPSEERVTLRTSTSVSPEVRASLLELADHVRTTLEVDVSVRGKVCLRHNSLQVLLESESKKVKKMLILDLTNNTFKTSKEFYEQLRTTNRGSNDV